VSELSGLYALWLREVIVFTRERSRVVAALVQPLTWLVIFGTGLGSSMSLAGIEAGVNYQSFIFPGIMCMTVLYGCLFFGLYIIMDKRVDFLKEVLVAPLSRTTIFFGKVLGGATDSIIEIVILMALGAAFFGIHFTPASLALSLIPIFILMIAVVSLGLTIGSLMDSPEGFGLIGSFVIFPLFFLSGALFPVNNLPEWLYAFVAVNPVSYTVDGLRTLILGIGSFGLPMDFGVTTAFAVVMVLIGTQAFARMKL
jgi:ABC-2 type transport system permease protein